MQKLRKLSWSIPQKGRRCFVCVCVWLGDEIQKWFSVCGAVVRKKAMWMKGKLQTVAKPKNQTSRSSLYLMNPRVLTGSLSWTSNTKAEYLFNETPSLQPPIGQGVIITFKSSDTYCIFSSIFDAREKQTFVWVSECWKSYSIADCTVNTESPWMN